MRRVVNISHTGNATQFTFPSATPGVYQINQSNFGFKPDKCRIISLSMSDTGSNAQPLILWSRECFSGQPLLIRETSDQTVFGDLEYDCDGNDGPQYFRFELTTVDGAAPVLSQAFVLSLLCEFYQDTDDELPASYAEKKREERSLNTTTRRISAGR